MKKASETVCVAMCDLDGMRYVYHTNYIKWFELARNKLFMEAGVHMEKWHEGGILLPIVELNVEYMDRAAFQDNLKVTAEVADIQRKVITLNYEIVNVDTGKVVTKGFTKQVVCDADHKAFVLQDVYPDIYDALMAD